MIDSEQEEQVLRRAVERGWVSEGEVTTAESDVPDPFGQPPVWRYSSRIDALIEAGYLEEAAVIALISELKERAVTSDRNGTSRSAEHSLPSEFLVASHSDHLDIHMQLATTLDGKHTAPTPAPATSPAPLPPALLQWDRYEVQSLLGRGGMGVVYKASDRRLHRIVALKFIHDVGTQTGQRLMREVRAQARIFHPGVCKVHEVGEIAGQLYIAMEYLSGQSLQIAQRNMTLDAKVQVIKDVAEALHAAHQLGIIHRGIRKPTNRREALEKRTLRKESGKPGKRTVTDDNPEMHTADQAARWAGLAAKRASCRGREPRRVQRSQSESAQHRERTL